MALKMRSSETVKRKYKRVVLCGPGGSGKSTAMGTIPKKALVIDLDHRWPGALVDKNDFAAVTESFKGVKEFLNEVLAETKLEQDWLVLDTCTKLMTLVEGWAIQQDCKGDRELYNKYGYGLKFSPQYFQEVLDLVEKIQEKHGINVCFICHTKLKSFKNPTGDDYMKNCLDLPEAVSDRLRQFADGIGFIFFDVEVDKDKKRVKGPAERFITFTDAVTHEAKNGMAWVLPERIPFDKVGKWGQLAFTGAYDENRDLVTQIDALIESYPANQKAEIRNKFETISYRTLPAKTLQEYITAAKTAKGEGK